MMSGRHAELLRGERRAGAAEAGDDLVEYQQDAVPVADLAQALQIALRRNQHAGRAGDRLDDDGGDGRGIVQRDEPLELIGEIARRVSGSPRENAFCCEIVVCGRWSTPGTIEADHILRFGEMPPTEMPPKFTP